MNHFSNNPRSKEKAKNKNKKTRRLSKSWTHLECFPKKAVCNILVKHTREEGARLVFGGLLQRALVVSQDGSRSHPSMALWKSALRFWKAASNRQTVQGFESWCFYVLLSSGARKEKREEQQWRGRMAIMATRVESGFIAQSVSRKHRFLVFLELNNCSEMIKYKSENKKITKTKSSSSEGE